MIMKTVFATALACFIAVAASAQTPVGTSGSTAPRPAPTGTTPTSSTSAPALPTASASTPTTASTAAAVGPDYRLTPGDKIRIDVYKDAQLSQALQVRPDGKITMPLIGDIQATGRTSNELRDAISKALADGKYLLDAPVTVIVMETVPQLIYVTGEVNRPGSYVMVNGQMSIMQALAVAGGLTEFANKKDIRVLRKGATGMQTLKFNYKDALDSIREPLALQAGDTVIVK
jgi:polysaccharide export outer membrane protein